MTGNEYQELALRTANGAPQLLNGVLGLVGESGEIADLVKKFMFQGHTLDHAHVAKELGDIAWYVAYTAKALGYTLDEVLQMNVDKLTARFPDGFDAEKSINRKKGDV